MDRKILIQRRQSLTTAQRKIKERAIAEKLLPFLKGNVGLYVPIKGEVDVFHLDMPQAKVYLPRMKQGKDLDFIAFAGSLRQAQFGVWEPEGLPCDPVKLDVIVVPMVGFCGLHRKGYGKGYYDRYLKKTNALRIGVAFDVQEDVFDATPFDVDMNVLITESKFLKE